MDRTGGHPAISKRLVYGYIPTAPHSVRQGRPGVTARIAIAESRTKMAK